MINIGLFGTCGKSTWRYDFISTYNHLPNVEYYNPQKDDWSPNDAILEAEHLANDDIVLFPVTDETYGLGSLSEVGFSILQVIKLNKNRDFVVYIDEKVNIDENDSEYDEKLMKESCRTRALIRQHLLKMNLSNVYVVNSLDAMLKVSLKLIVIQSKKQELDEYVNSLK